ncbi:MAG: DUF1934 domain-containing protein [Clostridia bacterium]|nr:DUF1934 domain-containing protein [Clostridia bacterium]
MKDIEFVESGRGEKKDVMIQSRAWARDSLDVMSDEIEWTNHGTLSRNGGAWCLEYRENISEDPKDPTMTDVKIQVRGTSVLVTRSGSFGMTMYLNQGHVYEGTYVTPFGEMKYHVQCLKAEVDLSEEAGSLDLSFVLEILGGGDTTTRYMKMKYWAVK